MRTRTIASAGWPWPIRAGQPGPAPGDLRKLAERGRIGSCIGMEPAMPASDSRPARPDAFRIAHRRQHALMRGAMVLILLMVAGLGCSRAPVQEPGTGGSAPQSRDDPGAGEPWGGGDDVPAVARSGEEQIRNAPPRAIPATAVPPPFPIEAVRRGESGRVLLRVPVSAEGRAGAVMLVEGSGSQVLDQAAIEAVSKWRFEPALADGVPVDSAAVVPIEFEPAD